MIRTPLFLSPIRRHINQAVSSPDLNRAMSRPARMRALAQATLGEVSPPMETLIRHAKRFRINFSRLKSDLRENGFDYLTDYNGKFLWKDAYELVRKRFKNPQERAKALFDLTLLKITEDARHGDVPSVEKYSDALRRISKNFGIPVDEEKLNQLLIEANRNSIPKSVSYLKNFFESYRNEKSDSMLFFIQKALELFQKECQAIPEDTSEIEKMVDEIRFSLEQGKIDEAWGKIQVLEDIIN